MEKLQEFVFGDFGVESPVEVLEEFDALHSGEAQEVFDAFPLPVVLFFGKKAVQKGPFVFGEVLGVGEEFKLFPEFR
jgi:hypothetical protein